MAALKGFRVLENIVPFVRNFEDQNDIGNTASPMFDKIEMTPAIFNGGGAVQSPIFQSLPAFVPFTTFPEGSRTEVLPIVNNEGISSRNNNRGAGLTGRFKNLGSGPTDGMGLGFDFWENIFLEPTRLDLGNVVSDVIDTVTLLNTFRRTNQSLDSLINNAGAGVTIAPPAPVPLKPFDSKTFTITVTTDGPPSINGTFDFITNLYTLTLIITGTRLIIFQYPPERAIREDLQWMTDIIRLADGSEQRHSVRASPRISVNYEVFSTSRSDVNNIRNLLIDSTSRVFGVPLWWFERLIIADVAALDTTVFLNVDATLYADFRVGGLAMVYQEDEDGIRTLDVLGILAVNGPVSSPESIANSITFLTPIQNSYEADKATVIPVVAGLLAQAISQTTPRVAKTTEFKLQFDLLDSDEAAAPTLFESGIYPDLDDFSGIPTMVLTDLNFMPGGSFNEKWQLELQRVDFRTGIFRQFTQELAARRSMPFSWNSEDSQNEWQIRSLLYFLRGKWERLWVPTWRDDFVLNTNIGLNAPSIDVDNHGFAKFVTDQEPWRGLRIRKNDGSVSYHRITIATEIDATTERITISPVAPFATLLTEIVQIDLLLLMRQSKDVISLTHNWHDADLEELDTIISTDFIGDLRT